MAKVRGRFLIVVDFGDGGSMKVETLPHLSLTPEQIVADLRKYADLIEGREVRRAQPKTLESEGTRA